MTLDLVKKKIEERYPNRAIFKKLNVSDITLDIEKEYVYQICELLKNDSELDFATLSDLSGVDHLDYGKSYWNTVNSTSTGFSRGHKTDISYILYMRHRFCVSYHLTSYLLNMRIRIRTFASLHDMFVPSVTDLWSTANWHEREVYDLFGVIFVGHPNLLRILTDYGFEGHPLRKDFPPTGEYEIRYDENLGKIVREASFIQREINTPKVVRKDFRYRK